MRFHKTDLKQLRKDWVFRVMVYCFEIEALLIRELYVVSHINI